MEQRLGHDFSHVRVHTDGKAAESARAVNALAYTVGRHVVFGANQLGQESKGGDQLLAHELAHVVQQRGNAPGATPSLGRDLTQETQYEREASAAAEKSIAGQPVSGFSSAPFGNLQRAAAESAPAPPKPKKPTRELRQNVGRGGNRVDAEIDRANCLLGVTMKVAFNFVNTPSPWPSEEKKTKWQSDFLSEVTERWNDRYALSPDRPPCEEETCNPFRTVLRVIPVTSGQHFTLTIGYTTSFQQSFVSERTATLDALDTARRSDIPQVPVEHEFGHMLGLPHIHCDANDDKCYGITAEEQADVMGRGSEVSERDYRVFAELLEGFNSCAWHPAPRSGGHAVIGGIAGAALGAGIGALLGPVGAIVGGLAGAGIGALIGSKI